MDNVIFLERIGELITTSLDDYKGNLKWGIIITCLVYVIGVCLNIFYQYYVSKKKDINTATRITQKDLQLKYIGEIYDKIVEIQDKLLNRDECEHLLANDIPELRLIVKKYTININTNILENINRLTDSINNAAAFPDLRDLALEAALLKRIKMDYQRL